MRKRVVSAACVAGAAALMWIGEAKADGFTWGQATLNGGPRLASDKLNLGLGLNAGYTLNMGLYLGGLADWYFAQNGYDVSFFMFDIGYDIGFGDKFVLRPSGTVGVVTAWFDRCLATPGGTDSCESDSSSEFGLTAGANAIYAIGQLTIGEELRFFWGHDLEISHGRTQRVGIEGIWAGFNIGVVF